MKRLIVFSFLVLSVASCKNESQSNRETLVTKEVKEEALPKGEQIYKGEFIYLSDAAVLTTRNEIYAVEINDKMHELNEVATALKKTEFDMVNVVIHGTIQPNPLKSELGEGWDQMVSITKIIEVTPATSANVIKTGKTLDIKEVK
ncbi:component of SufBCD complex [uncultured Nonlabens sp.]|uniref:component of SufBCD complex n=1 Tax=uncultured Nonlabens sp. TaxID=859306 RepID=UPI0026052F76|nr:component of SufBCD complex [uncultured Nonlabens sp.]